MSQVPVDLSTEFAVFRDSTRLVESINLLQLNFMCRLDSRLYLSPRPASEWNMLLSYLVFLAHMIIEGRLNCRSFQCNLGALVFYLEKRHSHEDSSSSTLGSPSAMVVDLFHPPTRSFCRASLL